MTESSGSPPPTRHSRPLTDSFRDAFRGVAFVLRTQRNSWIHLLAASLVTAAGLALGLTLPEWAVLALAVTLVLVAEMVNTALETLLDALSPEYHPLVGAAKDVAAGAVLLSSVGAVIVGLLVLGVRLVHLFGW